ncbi:hypothetical protein CH63R_11340 [Colletotrichum higginsianum IMI 349063]|uniref:Uncharacterized protein n=1 Tax=Colletotrichum higginsianum (strain IMI 349063) TaxID=759273 RepID=A0A1B7XXY7_COLHI|nr:hypothetical protein CH63R_11340 [Colletotrichum higginsianum IMI 349063]OBR04637.1 hypothetical protein CH63R_11340 [Colletotrichum higginsianum IMI 349063]
MPPAPRPLEDPWPRTIACIHRIACILVWCLSHAEEIDSSILLPGLELQKVSSTVKITPPAYSPGILPFPSRSETIPPVREHLRPFPLPYGSIKAHVTAIAPPPSRLLIPRPPLPSA